MLRLLLGLALGFGDKLLLRLKLAQALWLLEALGLWLAFREMLGQGHDGTKPSIGVQVS